MRLSIIVAVSYNNVIGRGGDLPWRIPADMVRFRELTMGHPVIMGRKTWESIPEKFRPLPGRLNIVVSSTIDRITDEVPVVKDLGTALRLTENEEEVFVIGGAGLYLEAIDLADRIYLTAVKAAVAGDTFFPAFDRSEWDLVGNEEMKADEKNAFDFAFEIWDRRKAE